MVYSYTPTYYSTLHDSITSLCKTILPFSLKKKRLPAAEHRLAKLQSDNLKWQQDSFHQILNLMGLHKEGILAENEVAAFRTHLLETLIASPPEHEQAAILRDKLVFLQELLYAQCISEDEYHSSKRPLLQRLAVQGAEIEARDVVVAGQKDPKEKTDEVWSVIDLKDDKCLNAKEETLQHTNKSKSSSAMKQIKGAASVFGFMSSHKQVKCREEKSIFDIEAKVNSFGFVNGEHENAHWEGQLKDNESETKSILMLESVIPVESRKESGSTDKTMRKPFRTLFLREQREACDGGGNNGVDYGEKASKSAKKQWGFDGFKKWKRNESEDETAPLPLNIERSDCEAFTAGSCHLVNSPIGEGPNTKQIKKKLHSNGSPSDFFIDKVVGNKIKKELLRIQTELGTSNQNFKFSDDQIEAISTKLPVDKADLQKFFPKSWCERYSDVVLDVVKKEFKDHVGEMEEMRNVSREKNRKNSMRWTTFDDDDTENCHPNFFAPSSHDYATSRNQNLMPKEEHAYANRSHGVNKSFENPFFHDCDLSSKTSSYQNPFWTSGHGTLHG
ncbi:hypothetical protein K2173_017878 [Erythroxylum novogranatense]|uniref:Uncharacterized protein n=1 Tax=Erythroxylum novogranatense TaxID=1862640 RepID=A0AAV8SMK5_9ROSI|nr:hypothetical protein K2173_017878 [Erythroxylum novogranatense]